ncbi:MAG: poly(3-hydroxybutyrate) depolymerase [Hyphomicrobiales bacterium]|nr:poly(3-hydroxybutyrate) depolymerase [Hyphomicrobiales bacterium]
MMTMRRLAPLALCFMTCASAFAAEPLPGLKADATQTSVSGLSSGAYMAKQFQVAHSKIVVGAGVVAGGPWGCAESAAARMAPIWATAIGYNLTQALQGCMQDRLASWGIPDVDALTRRARDFAADGRIDPLASLVTDKVYLYSGSADTVILPVIMDKTRAFYAGVGVPEAQVAFKRGAAGHAIVTMTEGAACGVTTEPFLNDCDYDQAGEMLRHIYGPLAAKAADGAEALIEFSQAPYLEGLSTHGMADKGVAFVPDACRRASGCRVHVAFHGCAQGREFVGDAHAKGAGLNAWAATNRIVVLYPQIKSAALTNPKGCWDWWGYTQLDYLSKDAPQITAVRRMIDALAR